MKQRILISVIFAMLSCSAGAQNQNVKKAFDYTYGFHPTSLPYYHSYKDAVDYRVFGFPTEEVKDKLDTRLWTNLQQTKYIDNDFQFESMERVFTPTNGSYKLGLVKTGAGDYYKLLLITVKSDGTIIDALEVGVSGGGYTYYWLSVKQFGITSNMEVTVYHIKATSATSLPFNSTQTSFTGQRIDTIYQINSSGKFNQVRQILHKSQTYAFSYLEYGKNIFKNGSETKQ